MTEPFTYRHSGLVVASQLELPEWEAFACDQAKPDVRIVISDEPYPKCCGEETVVEGDTLQFAIDGIGSWQVEGGHTIILHPGLTTAAAELRLFTLGSAWGAIGYQRGFAMWHGSAVERDGRAVLFCGDAGAGKSTMAAAMLADGATLVADDLSRVQPEEGGATIYPSSTRIKLWREAIDHYGWKDRILQRDYYRDDKFHCASERSLGGDAPLPLAAIVVLADGTLPQLERLSGAQTLEQVMSATLYRPEMLDAMSAWGSQGGLAAQVISSVPAFRLSRGKDFATLGEVVRLLDRLWED